MPKRSREAQNGSRAEIVNERVRLDLLLTEHGLMESRAKARAAIEAGGVTVDGKVIRSPSALIARGAVLHAAPAHPWVSRAGLKLDHALSLWPVGVQGRGVLDVGASTGGFTQVCLSRGARRVWAVDVGRAQLHASLAVDGRVISLEGVDARDLTVDLIPEPVELIVSDVSFISLTKALPAALALATPDADLIGLVKPQFEVGRAAVGRGGLVRDPAERVRALSEVSAWLRAQGWPVRATADSPVLGGDGNAEHLLWARRA